MPRTKDTIRSESALKAGPAAEWAAHELLLRSWRPEKACDEFVDELNRRPARVPLPLRAVPALRGQKPAAAQAVLGVAS